jgi:H+/Cl- antiporter ClcA
MGKVLNHLQKKLKSRWNKTFLANFYNLFLMSILTGFFAGGVVTIYNLLVNLGEQSSVEIYEIVRTHPVFVPLLFAVLVAGAFVIGTVVKVVPMIRGSGIPQIEGAARGIVHFKWYVTMCTMFASSLACIFLGLSAGGEGPSIEIGGCAGVATSTLLKRSRMVQRLQTASGASAGLAVAFNAPITGLVFAMEEAFRSFSPQVFLCSCISVIIALITRNLIRPLFGYEIGFTFTNYQFATFNLDLLAYAAMAAIPVALIGVAFYYLMLASKKLFKRITFCKGVGKFIIPFVLAGVFGLITPYAMGGGHSFLEDLATNGTGVYQLETVLGLSVFATIVLVVLFKFISSILAMSCGVPCGVFIPMLAVGAGLGSIFSIWFQKIGMPSSYADYLVIICMSVFFTAIVKAPITGIVMVFELTGQFQNVLPALVGIAIGYLISELFGTEAIYEKSLALFIEEENLYKGTEKRTAKVTIQPHSIADGELVRKIVWPTNSLVVELSHKRGNKTVPDGETVLHAGEVITVECEIASEEELYNYLYEIVGKPEQKK